MTLEFDDLFENDLFSGVVLGEREDFRGYVKKHRAGDRWRFSGAGGNCGHTHGLPRRDSLEMVLSGLYVRKDDGSLSEELPLCTSYLLRLTGVRWDAPSCTIQSSVCGGTVTFVPESYSVEHYLADEPLVVEGR